MGMAEGQVCCPTVDGSYLRCCGNAPAGDGDGDGDGEKPAVEGSASVLIMGMFCGTVLVCVFVGTIMCNRRARKDGGGGGGGGKNGGGKGGAGGGVADHHPHAVLAQRQNVHAMASAVDISSLAEDIAMATDAKERAALIEEMQARLEDAMNAAALAASAAAEAGPRHTQRLDFQPEFSAPNDILIAMERKKLAEEKFQDDYDDDGGHYDDEEDGGYAQPQGMGGRKNTMKQQQKPKKQKQKMKQAGGPTKRGMARKGTVRKMAGKGNTLKEDLAHQRGAEAKEMMERMRKTAAAQSHASGARANLGGLFPVRSATEDLEEARAIRKRLGAYAPNMEAKERARAKFRRALSKLKVKRLTGALLLGARKKKGHGKSLKRMDSQTWEHGGDEGRERRKRARRKSMAKKQAKKAQRKSRRKSRRATMQAQAGDDSAAAMAAAVASMGDDLDLGDHIDTIVEETGE